MNGKNNSAPTPKEKWQVLSPDGATIEREKFSYNSREKAEKAFEKWKNGYSFQGYYSYNMSRIPLDVLKNYCTFKKLN